MTDPIRNLIIITGVFFILFIAWAISIGITYWDIVSKRKLSGAETAAWIALVILVPGIGFVGYWFGRFLERVLAPGGAVVEKPRQGTILKPQWKPEQRSETISAVDILPPASPEGLRTQKTMAVLDNGAPKFKLTIIKGPQTGLENIIERLPVKIGRGSDVDIPLNEDQGISRQHAEIYEQNGGLCIRDLNSTHGTLVNESAVIDTPLQPGDQIHLGMTILLVGVQEKPV